MADRFDWNPEPVLAKINAELTKRVTAACILVANRAKVLLSTAGTMKHHEAEGRARHDPGFAKQFNKNRAFVMRKGKETGVHLTRGRIHTSRNFKK